MDSIEVDGAVLSAMALGPAAAPPVALLHGLVRGNMATWYSSAALPLAAGRRVVLYDQRGHGGSTMPRSGFDLDRQAADLDRVLAHYGYATNEIDLVGHSMGALIALRFALRRPHRVRRLILADAPMPASRHVAPSLRDLMASAADGVAGRRRARLRQRLHDLLGETTLLADVAAMQAEPEHSLACFERPVLLIYGADSPCREAATRLHGLLPRATLSWLPAGHELPAEVPRELLRCIEDFLAAPDGAPHRSGLRAEAV